MCKMDPVCLAFGLEAGNYLSICRLMNPKQHILYPIKYDFTTFSTSCTPPIKSYVPLWYEDIIL